MHTVADSDRSLGTLSSAGVRDLSVGVEVTIVHCHGARLSQTSLTYAYIAEPIPAASAPFAATMVPDDGWRAVAHWYANNETVPVFKELGYEIVPVPIQFQIDDAAAGGSIAVRVGADQTALALQATFGNTGESVVTGAALVSETAKAHLAIIGPQSGTSYELEVRALQTYGGGGAVTSEFRDGRVRLERNVTGEPVFWREPKSSANGEND